MVYMLYMFIFLIELNYIYIAANSYYYIWITLFNVIIYISSRPIS